MIYLSELADAVVTFLQSIDLGDGVTIARRRIVSESLENLQTGAVKVSVVPFAKKSNLVATGISEKLPQIRVVVQAKLSGQPGSEDGESADAAARISEQIADSLIGSTILTCECQSADMVPSYENGFLVSVGVFDATIVTNWSECDE